MNKVYKVIWSRTRNAYIVVSQLAKNHAKSGRCIASAAGALLLLMTGPALAADYTGEGTGTASHVVAGTKENTKGENSLTIMDGTTEEAAKTSLAIGPNAITSGEGALAIGLFPGASPYQKTTATGKHSVAIGANATTDGDGAIAFGSSARAEGASSVAISPYSSALDMSTAIGVSSHAENLGVALGGGSSFGGVALGRVVGKKGTNASYATSGLAAAGGESTGLGATAIGGAAMPAA